jgi:hypothetical protein
LWAYFRTDHSYNPELSTYLAQLLADRERLATAIPELAEWARLDATPSDAQIDSVRRLLSANNEVLAGLDDDDRAAVETAIATIRTHRAGAGRHLPAELAGLAHQSAPSSSRPSSAPPTSIAAMAEHPTGWPNIAASTPTPKSAASWQR